MALAAVKASRRRAIGWAPRLEHPPPSWPSPDLIRGSGPAPPMHPPPSWPGPSRPSTPFYVGAAHVDARLEAGHDGGGWLTGRVQRLGLAPSWPGLSRPSTPSGVVVKRRGCPAQGRA